MSDKLELVAALRQTESLSDTLSETDPAINFPTSCTAASIAP